MKIKKSSPLAKIKRGLATRLRGGQDESDDCNNESKTPRAGVSKRRKKKYPAKKNPLSSEFKRETHQTLTISLEVITLLKFNVFYSLCVSCSTW